MKRTPFDSKSSDSESSDSAADDVAAGAETSAADATDSPVGHAATTSVISRKELGRQLRRQAYQKAKAYRAKDPKYLALKEAAKLHRRQLYQQVKQSRKAATSGEKAERSQSRAQAATDARQVREQQHAQRKSRQGVPQREQLGELMKKLSHRSSAAVSPEGVSPEGVSEGVSPEGVSPEGVSEGARTPPSWKSLSSALTDVPIANDVS